MEHPVAAPIIVTATFVPADFQWLDGLRRAHYPPDRNQLPAHLILFRHLPPSALGELVRLLKIETRDVPPPPARLAALMSLGRGVGFRVQSDGLAGIRDRIADALAGQLTPQDQAWRPHVTIQNKVAPAVAKALLAQLEAGFRPRPIGLAGLAAFFYRDGPWEPIASFAFNRSGRSRRS